MVQIHTFSQNQVKIRFWIAFLSAEHPIKDIFFLEQQCQQFYIFVDEPSHSVFFIIESRYRNRSITALRNKQRVQLSIITFLRNYKNRLKNGIDIYITNKYFIPVFKIINSQSKSFSISSKGIAKRNEQKNRLLYCKFSI